MPRHQYIGKQVERTDKYVETRVSFEDIVNSSKMENIRKPNYQGSLLEEKVEKMVEEYLENPLLLKFKNTIIIGCLKTNWYIIDGQHRIEMANILYRDHNINDNLVFCWYLCDAEDEMKEIFRSVNMDSLKNQYYVTDDDIRGIIKEEFTGKLKDYHKTHFAKRKTDTGNKKTIEEFVLELDSIQYFDTYSSSQEAYDNLKKENTDFYNINRYAVDIINNSSIYYAEEKKLINEKVIFTLKRNNFIEWMSDKSKDPYHNTRIIKANISTYKRNATWRREFDEATTGICPISFCTNILKKGVKNGFQCGHIVSEYNGGVTEVNKMRPICPGCNQSMGKKNWNDWDI